MPITRPFFPYSCWLSCDHLTQVAQGRAEQFAVQRGPARCAASPFLGPMTDGASQTPPVARATADLGGLDTRR